MPPQEKTIDQLRQMLVGTLTRQDFVANDDDAKTHTLPIQRD
jgi:hypothetical protein